MQGLTVWLWYKNEIEAEGAARFYTSIFEDGKITQITRYPDTGDKLGVKEGSLMHVLFTANGIKFAALNGGPAITKTEGVSLAVNCDTQEEIDYYWDKLGEGGSEESKYCGWLKDKYGLSWQVVPTQFEHWITERDSAAASRVLLAAFKMRKLDIATLQAAWDNT